MYYELSIMYKKIKSFTDLIAWQEAHKLVLMIYKITKNFPKEEMYALSDQIKRASVSISSNIAEGFSRKTSKDKRHFYYQALGSLTEVQNQLIIAKDVKFIDRKCFDTVAQQTISVSKLTNSLIKYLILNT